MVLLRDVFETFKYIHDTQKKKHIVVTVLCQKKLAEELIKYICIMDKLDDINMNLEYIHFDKELKTEYGVIFIYDNGEYRLNIETAWNVDKYRVFHTDYLYISGDCSDELFSSQFIDNDYIKTFRIKV